MTKQKMIDILKLIIAKSPAAAREASTAIRAINADSPIIQQRCNWVAEMALNDRQADFSADDRAYIASLMDSEGDSEITSVSVRMTKVQVAEARRLAEEQGYADLSKFIRDRIGLPE